VNTLAASSVEIRLQTLAGRATFDDEPELEAAADGEDDDDEDEPDEAAVEHPVSAARERVQIARPTKAVRV
jgi:hypothetical protein